ncbi:MAG: hypothetical protein ABSF14_20360 [Terriglobia bacterium]|jgi:hypothetical protein
MPSIDKELDAALVGCKHRAAEFDDHIEWRPMGKCGEVDLPGFLRRAATNLGRARLMALGHWEPDDALRRDLRDAANMILLALSILERRTGGEK